MTNKARDPGNDFSKEKQCAVERIFAVENDTLYCFPGIQEWLQICSEPGPIASLAVLLPLSRRWRAKPTGRRKFISSGSGLSELTVLLMKETGMENYLPKFINTHQGGRFSG